MDQTLDVVSLVFIQYFYECINGSIPSRWCCSALDYLRLQNKDSVQIWWRTYSPPSWILGNNSTETIAIDTMIDVDKSINIIDCMGTDFEDVKN